MQTRRLTNGPKHHFFGFHDIAITSRTTGLYLGLSVDRIDRPPLGNDEAGVIVWEGDTTGEKFEPKLLTRTRNYNFPQGARQQWLGDSDIVVVNKVDKQARPVAELIDASSGTTVGQISTSTYCTDRTGAISYTVDFGRLHRLGGYGHSNVRDFTPDEMQPNTNGIFRTEIAADQTKLLMSIRDIAQVAGIELKSSNNLFVTHLRLNPTENRIAFLLRYRLPDAGEETCLCTVGTDGSAPRVLARGFVSHFDWIGQENVMFWGRRNEAVATLRRHPLLANPIARVILPLAKRPLRAILGRSAAMKMSYLKVPDVDGASIVPFGLGVLEADGHPMCNPVQRGWLVTDTYPDADDERDLMLYDISANQRIDLGRYRKIDTLPSPDVVTATAAHIESHMAVDFPAALYAFTRSGLHCDLHPRWSADGRVVAFDSIHEGTRQIYSIDVAAIMATSNPAMP